MGKKEKFRIERDILGSVKVPSDAYYGIFTVRAVKNFPISSLRIPKELNRALIEVKMAAALANMDCGVLDRKVGRAIVKACKKLLREGRYDREFVVDVYQAGAGTPWHMNVNEVVANLALEILGKRKGSYSIVDPHDHVNLGQSTNDVVPTGIRIACVRLTKRLESELKRIIVVFAKKERQFKSLVKIGRTHLQHAVPITLGKEFGAWRSDLEKRLDVLKGSLGNLLELHIGGSAVGTGLNVAPGFDRKCVAYIRKITGIHFRVARNKIEGTQFMGDFLDLSGALRTIVSDLGKIANDIRLLSSGPTSGLNEISLPELEPGSSIMPGKINPSIAEMMNMVCYQVIGNDETIQHCVESGQLELNVMTPVLAYNLIQSLEILNNGIREFNENGIARVKANDVVLKKYFAGNPGVGAVLNSVIGYERTAKVVREAIRKNKSIREVVIEKKIIGKKEADKLFSNRNFRI